MTIFRTNGGVCEQRGRNIRYLSASSIYLPAIAFVKRRHLNTTRIVQRAMARVVIVIAIAFSMMKCVTSQCSLMTVPEAQQLIRNTLEARGADVADSNFTVHTLNTNCLSASNTRGYTSTTIAVNYTMSGPSGSTTDVAQITCLCDPSSNLWNTDSSANLLVSSSDALFGSGELSAAELLTIEADKSCSVCALSLDNGSPTLCIRKYRRPKSRALTK